MPQQVATGLMGIPVMALARLVASSATFRSVVGAITAIDAIDRAIYWLEADDVSEPEAAPGEEAVRDARPRAIIDWPDTWTTKRQGPGTWSDSGGLLLSFEFKIPVEYLGRKKEEALWFLNTVGAIIDEMRENSGRTDASSNPYLNATSFSTEQNPAPCVRSEEVEYFWGVTFKVDWPT